MHEPTSSSHRFLVLDGLRGAAALLVITDHIPSAIAHVFPSRALAVDFFFILSGFVLAHAYSDRLANNMTAAGFLVRRLIRLYPLYLLGLAIGVLHKIASIACGVSNPVPAGEFAAVTVSGLAFLPWPPVFDWTQRLLFPFDNAAWSLFFELTANIAFAGTVMLRRPGVLRPLLLIAAAVLILVNLWTGFGAHGWQFPGDQGWEWPSFAAGFPRIAFTFFAGVVLCDAWKRMRIPAIPAWLAFLILFAIAAGSLPLQGYARISYDLVAQLVLLPCLVLFAAGARVNGLFATACGQLGTLSYGVYVLHLPILQLSNLVLTAAFHTSLQGSYNVGLIATLALLAAWIATRFYDEPLRAWLQRVLLGA